MKNEMQLLSHSLISEAVYYPAVEASTWTSHCILLFSKYVIIYPCPNPDTGFVGLC